MTKNELIDHWKFKSQEAKAFAEEAKKKRQYKRSNYWLGKHIAISDCIESLENEKVNL